MSTVSYAVTAFNYAEESDNKIHSDDVARQFGFSGALVPGVADFAYLARATFDHWRESWLHGGTLEGKLIKPIYHGERAEARGEETEQGLVLNLYNAAGDLCATGHASRRGEQPAPKFSEFPAADPIANDERPQPSIEDFAKGRVLAPHEYTYDATHTSEEAAHMFVENFPARGATPIWHPALCLHDANRLLRSNVALGPWIHTASAAHYLDQPEDGDRISIRGKVHDTYEKRGHIVTELDVAVFANAERPLARIRHSAIIRLATG